MLKTDFVSFSSDCHSHRLRPDKLFAAAAAAVVDAHPNVDASCFGSLHTLNISAAVTASCASRSIVILQHDHADSVGNIIEYSEEHLGYGPVIYYSFSQPTSSDISEFVRTQRVGGWVIVVVLENGIFNHLQWLVDLMIPTSEMLDDNVVLKIENQNDESRRINIHDQFRLWIVTASAAAVPPQLLHASHIMVHEINAQSFASTAAAAIQTASAIRKDPSLKCTQSQQFIITITALFHALFSFKALCSASLSLSKYEAIASLPPMQIQILQAISWIRAAEEEKVLGEHRGSVQTPNSQMTPSSNLNTAVPARSSAPIALKENLFYSKFLEVMNGGCGILMEFCGDGNERKRLNSLAENILQSIANNGFSSSSVAECLSLPIPLILAAEAGDSAAVASCLPLVDLKCAALGPDVQRVSNWQQSRFVMANVTALSNPGLETVAVQTRANDYIFEHSERCTLLFQNGAPCRPNSAEDFFLLNDGEHLPDAQSELEVSIKSKISSPNAQRIEVDPKILALKPNAPQNVSMHQVGVPKLPPLHAVLMTLHEVLLALPERIGAAVDAKHLSYSLTRFYSDSKSLEHAIRKTNASQRSHLSQDDHNQENNSLDKSSCSSAPNSYLTKPFALFLLKEAQHWNCKMI
jgi:hypothetical protein